MMKKLLERVRMLVRMELKEARKNNGQFFHSLHEGHSVIWEEMEEAREEVETVEETFQELMYFIRVNAPCTVNVGLKRIEEHAISAACEYIQVAAMARKMREGNDENSVRS